MESITFNNIRRDSSGCSFDVISSKRASADTLTFKTPFPSRTISDTALACVMATIAGQGYREVYADIPLSKETIDKLETFTGAKWKVKSVVSEFSLHQALNKICLLLKKRKNSFLLNFSGGFDSLAAKALMPDSTNLVSVDFGGWFERETKFFTSFETNILQTNFRQLKYDRESWTFMGAGAFLMAEALHAQYNVFGTILEATQAHFNPSVVKTDGNGVLPFSILGLRDARITNGLTEVCTAMIVTHYYPELVHQSIESLAANGSEKKYRKQILTSIICKKYNRNVQVQSFSEPKENQRVSWGTNFALDFLALYELKNAGMSIVEKTVSDIPKAAIELADRLSLQFYERLNPKFLNDVPGFMRSDYLKKLEAADVTVYNSNDWEEFNAVTALLAEYYPAIKNH